MKERNKILFLSIVILGILSSSLRISISVSTVVPQHEAQGTLGSEAILIKKITEGSILSSTFFPLDNLAIISILLLVGLSMIFYALIKYMAERKKGGKITGYNATEKFEDNKDKESEEQFGLKTANDEVIAVGEGYGSKNYSSLNEIKSVKKNASTGKFEVYKDKAGEYRFRLKAINGEVIAAASQGYSSKNSCMTGIKSVKKNAPKASIIELEE